MLEVCGEVSYIPSSTKKSKKLVFLFQIFLNQDASPNISLKHLRFGVFIDNTHMEEIVSQILYLGPSFLFMKSRIIF